MDSLAGQSGREVFIEKGREKDVYEDIFRKSYVSLMFYATRFVNNAQAEDIIQDAFMDLWERRAVIVMGSQVRAFLYRSVYTRALNRLKREKLANGYAQAAMNLYIARAEFFWPDNNDVIRALESDELGVLIERVIDQLPQKCREVFRLSYQCGLKNMQIADALGISLRTVEAHMYKALGFLRDKLKDRVF